MSYSLLTSIQYAAQSDYEVTPDILAAWQDDVIRFVDDCGADQGENHCELLAFTGDPSHPDTLTASLACNDPLSDAVFFTWSAPARRIIAVAIYCDSWSNPLYLELPDECQTLSHTLRWLRQQRYRPGGDEPGTAMRLC